jgi:hypothetical protein
VTGRGQGSCSLPCSVSAATVMSAAVYHPNMGPVAWGPSSFFFFFFFPFPFPQEYVKNSPSPHAGYLTPDHHWYDLGLCIVVAIMLYDPQKAVQVGPGNCLDPGDTVERRRFDNAAHKVYAAFPATRGLYQQWN